MNGIGDLATWGIIFFLWFLCAAYLAVNVFIFVKNRIWENLTIAILLSEIVRPLFFLALVALVLNWETRDPENLSAHVAVLVVVFAPLVVDVIRISKWLSLK